MKDKEYFKLILKKFPRDQEDLLVAWCFEHGAAGVEEILPFHQNLDDYSVASEAKEAFDCTIYFLEIPARGLIDEVRSRWPAVSVDFHKEMARDWLEEWKKGFKPFELVSGVWIVPHWCSRPAEARAVIWLEPGMAFGTGTHETTRLAAELLAQALAKRPGARVLDVGTGTGILAILARLLGASTVVGTDVDPEAVRVARENLGLNRIGDIDVTDRELSEVSGSFDVVVANIIDGVLVALQRGLKEKVADGGALVLSGIIDERRESFRQKFVLGSLKLVAERQRSEWHAYLMEK